METIEYKNYKIHVEQDQFSYDSPRDEQDYLSKLCLFHNRYNFPNESGYNPDNYNSWNEFISDVIKNENPVMVLTVRMYDHSGIGLSADALEKNRYPYNCPWDSGTVGFIYTKKSDVYKEYNVKRISPKLKSEIVNKMVQDVKTFSQWVNGEIYSYWIENENGENIDSCGGFYGYNFNDNGLMETAKDAINFHIEELNKEETSSLQLAMSFIEQV